MERGNPRVLFEQITHKQKKALASLFFVHGLGVLQWFLLANNAKKHKNVWFAMLQNVRSNTVGNNFSVAVATVFLDALRQIIEQKQCLFFGRSSRCCCQVLFAQFA